MICPEAETKLFVTASDEVRALRRWQELRDAGEEITAEEVLETLRARDQRDAERADAPMTMAEDATVLDTSEMSIEDAVTAATELVAQRLEQTR